MGRQRDHRLADKLRRWDAANLRQGGGPGGARLPSWRERQLRRLKTQAAGQDAASPARPYEPDEDAVDDGEKDHDR